MDKRQLAVETIQECWNKPPTWVAALAQRIDEMESQKKVAVLVGYSVTAVNQVLKNKYKGSLTRVERAVRAALMDETVSCPVLGEITDADCKAHQARPFSAANAQRVQLFHACKRCEHKE